MIPAFAFPAEAGTHLPTRRDGRLSWPWVAGWLHTEINENLKSQNERAIVEQVAFVLGNVCPRGM